MVGRESFVKDNLSIRACNERGDFFVLKIFFVFCLINQSGTATEGYNVQISFFFYLKRKLFVSLYSQLIIVNKLINRRKQKNIVLIDTF